MLPCLMYYAYRLPIVNGNWIYIYVESRFLIVLKLHLRDQAEFIVLKQESWSFRVYKSLSVVIHRVLYVELFRGLGEARTEPQHSC
jgi:hypothetical protein